MVELISAGQRKLVSLPLLLHSLVVKLILLTKWLADKKEISSVTDAKLIMLLELRLITSFRPHKTAESCVAQREQCRPLRAALLRWKIGL